MEESRRSLLSCGFTAKYITKKKKRRENNNAMFSSSTSLNPHDGDTYTHTGAMDYDRMCKAVTTDPMLVWPFQFLKIITTIPKKIDSLYHPHRMLSLLYAPRIFSTNELDGIAASLLKTSIALHTSTIMLGHLLQLEFEKVASTNSKVILRANTLATKVMDQYIRML